MDSSGEACRWNPIILTRCSDGSVSTGLEWSGIESTFINCSAGAALSAGIDNSFGNTRNRQHYSRSSVSAQRPSVRKAQGISRDISLTVSSDLAAEMVNAIYRFLPARTGRQAANRDKHWNRDYSSPRATSSLLSRSAST
jgi:hypothetical protein